MKKYFVLIVSCLLWGVVANAQPQKVIEKDFENFSTIKIEDKFDVKLISSDRYAVRINVDERIASHVQAYEKNGILYLSLDERGYTKDLKKQLRQKGASQPALEAEIYMPSVNSLVFSDQVFVRYCDELKSENFTLTASDNVKIQQLRVACSTADFNVAKSVDMTAEMTVASKLYLAAANTAKVSLIQNGGNCFLELGGSAYVDMKAAVQSLEVIASSGSESHISGTASLLTVNAMGMSRTDAELLEVKEGQITQTGSSKCHVNVTDKMKVNLTGGCMLTFKRTPVIEVERIVGSTLIKADDPKRK
jgi:hypothetical protein